MTKHSYGRRRSPLQLHILRRSKFESDDRRAAYAKTAALAAIRAGGRAAVLPAYGRQSGEPDRLHPALQPDLFRTSGRLIPDLSGPAVGAVASAHEAAEGAQLV